MKFYSLALKLVQRAPHMKRLMQVVIRRRVISLFSCSPLEDEHLHISGTRRRVLFFARRMMRDVYTATANLCAL